MYTKPIHQHDCQCCGFLGSYKGHDLYEHRRSPQTAIARYGLYGDYHSGKGSQHPDALREANLRAGFSDKEHERLTAAYADEYQGVILNRYVNTPRPEECVAASRQYFEALTWVTDIGVITRCLQKSLETALEDSPLRDVLMTQVVQNISRAFKAADMTQEDIDAWKGQPWELLIANKDISWPVDLLGCPGYAEKMTSLLDGYFTGKDS